jgi:glycosyltransferase involved in cell wall biosynthesis
MNSNQIIFISQFLSKKSYGASKVSNINANFLKSIFKVKSISWADKGIADFNFNSSRNKLNRGLMLIMGFSGNLTFSILISIIRVILRLDKKKQIIWLDSSLLGHLTFLFHILGFKTIVFFHNCEVDLIEPVSKTILNSIRNRSIKISERLSIKYASKIISISKNDGERIKEYYNRNVDVIFPPFIEMVKTHINSHEKTIGFLGSDWYPNEYAINFILDIAIDLPDYKFFIGGDICKRVKNKIPDNVELLGYLDNIDSFYDKVHTILSPVIFGGGIKIKVLEAIQFNKIIIGSEHSIKGYEAFNELCYFTANERKDYINLIRNQTGIKQVDSSEIIDIMKSMNQSISKEIFSVYQELTI